MRLGTDATGQPDQRVALWREALPSVSVGSGEFTAKPASVTPITLSFERKLKHGLD